MVLPLLASGHGAEFLEAKFYFDSYGTAHLEVTADYSGNPMIADVKEARAALDDILRVKFDDKEYKLTDLAPVSLKEHHQPDPESPMPRAPEFENMKHELLTASWQWRPEPEQMRFQMLQGRQNSMLFWMREEGIKQPRWVMLIAGDETPEITVPEKPARLQWLAGLGGLLIVLFGLGWLWRKQRSRRKLLDCGS